MDPCRSLMRPALEIELCTAREQVRAARALRDPPAADERERAERGVSIRDEPTGNRTVIAQMSALTVAVFEALLDAEVRNAPADASGLRPELVLHRRMGETWKDGGETTLANLISLCTHHHTFIHERLAAWLRTASHNRQGSLTICLHNNGKPQDGQ